MSAETTEANCSKTRNPFTGVEADAVSVRVDGLSKKFGDLAVLRNISFDVKPGEIFVIMGPSGSGKSVLLRHIAGLEAPTSGTVAVDGLDPTLEETRDRVRLALVFQEGALFNSLSVYDNLALYPREHRSGNEMAISERVMHALKILSVEKSANQFPSELSGGMKKRVSIARARHGTAAPPLRRAHERTRPRDGRDDKRDHRDPQERVQRDKHRRHTRPRPGPHDLQPRGNPNGGEADLARDPGRTQEIPGSADRRLSEPQDRH